MSSLEDRFTLEDNRQRNLFEYNSTEEDLVLDAHRRIDHIESFLVERFGYNAANDVIALPEGGRKSRRKKHHKKRKTRRRKKRRRKTRRRKTRRIKTRRKGIRKR